MTGCRIGKVTLKEATEVTRDEMLADVDFLEEAADLLRSYRFANEAFAIDHIAFAIRAHALAHVGMTGPH